MIPPPGIHTLVSIPSNECGLDWITCFQWTEYRRSKRISLRLCSKNIELLSWIFSLSGHLSCEETLILRRQDFSTTMWMGLEVDPLQSSSHQDFGWDMALLYDLNETSWDTLGQRPPTKLSWIPDSNKLFFFWGGVILLFKLLNFGLIFYTTIDKQHRLF